MTMTDGTARTDRAKLKKVLLSALGGAVVGLLGASGVMHLIEAGRLGEPDGSQVVALLVALVYVLTGLIVLIGAMSPAAGSRFLNVEDADELREQKGVLTSSGWATLLLGALLAVIALGGQGGLLSPLAALVLALVLLAISIPLSMRVLRQSDELMRTLSSDAAEAGYYVIFLVIGGWAMLAHLGFLQAPAMLDILTAFWALGLATTFAVTGRRGLLDPR